MTRVNRPYKSFRYGYVVAFADIRAEFDKTNQAYFKELQAELGDEFQRYIQHLQISGGSRAGTAGGPAEAVPLCTDNAELFSQQITALDDKQELYDLRKALETCKELSISCGYSAMRSWPAIYHGHPPCTAQRGQ